jgi:hypothetical protein
VSRAHRQARLRNANVKIALLEPPLDQEAVGLVIAGLDPAIHPLEEEPSFPMDARVKRRA